MPPSAHSPVSVLSAKAEEELPPLPDASAGDVYLAVRGQGILRLDGDRAVMVFPTKNTLQDLEVGPGGSLFSSFSELGTFQLERGAKEAKKISTKDYQRLAFRSDSQLWATPDRFGWAIHHFDGKSWAAGKTREDFKGGYDDNKLNDLAVTPDAVWLSSWNGLFKSAGGPRDAWTKATLPAGEKPPYNLVSRGDHVIGQFSNGWYEWDDKTWILLSWPSHATIADISPTGVAVGIDTKNFRSVVTGKLGPDEPIVMSTLLSSPSIDDVEIDSRGRAWVAGSLALSVIHPNGKVLREYMPGVLAGVTGRIEKIAIAAGGPDVLPTRSTPRRLTVKGKVELYKNGKALDNVVVEICAGYKACGDDAWKRATTTAADGSFSLTQVIPGDLTVSVQSLAGLEECQTPFTAGGTTSFTVADDCPPDGDICDVGTISACQPFEMPPPHYR